MSLTTFHGLDGRNQCFQPWIHGFEGLSSPTSSRKLIEMEAFGWPLGWRTTAASPHLRGKV